jgi:hypothetical protein
MIAQTFIIFLNLFAGMCFGASLSDEGWSTISNSMAEGKSQVYMIVNKPLRIPMPGSGAVTFQFGVTLGKDEQADKDTPHCDMVGVKTGWTPVLRYMSLLPEQKLKLEKMAGASSGLGFFGQGGGPQATSFILTGGLEDDEAVMPSFMAHITPENAASLKHSSEVQKFELVCHENSSKSKPSETALILGDTFHWVIE